ncbi:phage integrase SAM-like domain-containing protein [[Flexibacter] sp. ATCC 35208]|uniref:phage integrase SAM-like domain-containing protein n=1 Tax=[Flexibacter] sp. ATCC 35208 TaxID=1936242 RepID=UPI0009C89962|nr:phage integrase SAM-like domain-containing protein [[Flexibacter] sp. ATCC 35208]OMP75494.1 hypothetical protein BW716_29740 [[Flexibacter] sp. ATCC 35208]
MRAHIDQQDRRNAHIRPYILTFPDVTGGTDFYGFPDQPRHLYAIPFYTIAPAVYSRIAQHNRTYSTICRVTYKLIDYSTVDAVAPVPSSANGSGVCSPLRCYAYARIVVNKTKCELGMKQQINPSDWNEAKGCAKSKSDELRRFNSYLEEVRAKLVWHYQQLRLGDEGINADMVKQTFLNYDKPVEQHSLMWLIGHHNEIMKTVLAPGTMKKYRTTESYLQLFIKKHYGTNDVLLRGLTFEFITGFEHYIGPSH